MRCCWQNGPESDASGATATSASGGAGAMTSGAMTSGRLNDDVHGLLDWLGRAEVYLAEEQPILGDLDTVNVLIEKHKVTAAPTRNNRPHSRPAIGTTLQSPVFEKTWTTTQKYKLSRFYGF